MAILDHFKAVAQIFTNVSLEKQTNKMKLTTVWLVRLHSQDHILLFELVDRVPKEFDVIDSLLKDA